MENVFKQQLVKLRRQRNLSQEQLAGQLFVSRQAISKWELGESTPDLETLVRLANLLQVDFNELIGGEQAQPTAPTTSFDEEEEREYGRRPMNVWEFLADYWWAMIPLIGTVGWAISRIVGH